MNTHRITDGVQFDQVLAPASRTAGTVASAYVDLSGFDGVCFIVDVGAISAGGTIDLTLKQATASAGTGAKNITAASVLTTITDAGGSTAGTSSSLYAVEVRTSELDGANNFNWVAASFVTGTAANISGIVAIRFRPRTLPVSSNLVQKVQA